MKQTFSLSAAFESAGVPLSERDLVTAVAAARRVAYSLPLPQDPVGSPADFFKENYEAQAEQAIGGLNETCVLDFDLCAAVTKLYWLARYRVLHDPDSIEAMRAVTGLVEDLLQKEPVTDLGFTMDPQGGSQTRVAVVDGRTTLIGSLAALSASAESLRPCFESLWGNDTKGG
jgi:hypothetical protein